MGDHGLRDLSFVFNSFLWSWGWRGILNETPCLSCSAASSRHLAYWTCSHGEPHCCQFSILGAGILCRGANLQSTLVLASAGITPLHPSPPACFAGTAAKRCVMCAAQWRWRLCLTGCFQGVKYSLGGSIQWGTVCFARTSLTHRPRERRIPLQAKTMKVLLLEVIEANMIAALKELYFCNDVSLLFQCGLADSLPWASLHAAVRSCLVFYFGARSFCLWVPILLSRNCLEVIYGCWQARTSGSSWDGDGCLLCHADQCQPHAASIARWQCHYPSECISEQTDATYTLCNCGGIIVAITIDAVYKHHININTALR